MWYPISPVLDIPFYDYNIKSIVWCSYRRVGVSTLDKPVD